MCTGTVMELVLIGKLIVMIKMSPTIKEEIDALEREREGWRGKNKYIFKKLNWAIKLLKHELNEPKKLTFVQYKEMTMIELKEIAKELKIPKYYNLKEDALIVAIMKEH